MSYTVGTSVQELVDELNDMIQVANNLSFIDVGMMVTTCKERVDNLVSVYQKYPEDEARIRQLKTELEIKALQLEYFIQSHTSFYRDRYKLRAFATVFENDIRIILMNKTRMIKETGSPIKANDDVNVDVLTWLDYYRFATNLKARSNHVIFELNADDEFSIKSISARISTYKSEHQDEFGGCCV